MRIKIISFDEYNKLKEVNKSLNFLFTDNDIKVKVVKKFLRLKDLENDEYFCFKKMPKFLCYYFEKNKMIYLKKNQDYFIVSDVSKIEKEIVAYKNYLYYVSKYKNEYLKQTDVM